TNCADPLYTCTNQGISAGCSDLYGANLGCQYLDITDVPSGNYVLRVTIDPFGRISELSESNNVAQQSVTITRAGSTPQRTATPTRTATPARTATRTPSPSRTTTPSAAVTPTSSSGTTVSPAATSLPTITPTPIAGCDVAAI